MADQTNEKPKASVVQVSAEMVGHEVRVARFRGRPIYLQTEPYPHWRPMHKDTFEQIAYPLLGGVSRSRINDVFAYVSNTAKDLTPFEDLILFGLTSPITQYDHEANITHLWDMSTLSFRDDIPKGHAIWRSPFGVAAPPAQPAGDGPRPRLAFIMALAAGDEGLYDDIMQSLAPLVMKKKPDGVIWWVGDGANGKSTLMEALYRIFPHQLSSITVKRLVDGRDTPSLNGTLANVVKESSEGRIEDTEIYKAVGTHENFRVHKFHSQDDIEIKGNVHHIFSANSVPTFNDKGYSARRRTFIVPFPARFESDPNFEERTFTPEFFGQLISEMCYYARILERQGFRYKWSAATLAAKAEYDSDANNAEEYAREIIQQGVVAFDSFNPVRIDYENWCADNGYVPLGLTNLRRALTAHGFERRSQQTVVNGAAHIRKIYRLPVVKGEGELQPMGMGRPGLHTIPGFAPEEQKDVTVASFETPVEPVPEPPKPKKSVLNGKW